jgi:hypothetical protein
MNLIDYYNQVSEQLEQVLSDAGIESLEHWMKNKKSGKLRVSEQIAYLLGQINLIQSMVGEEE